MKSSLRHTVPDPDAARRGLLVAYTQALVGHIQLAVDWRNGVARIGRVMVAPIMRGQGLAKSLPGSGIGTGILSSGNREN
ncbi:GNAT family N-acetyltransferase [Sinorhizobium meliloti]|uniref:GNAT family N-acetyltransferase n=1 Tax=Rhizobium meliloti TaxID=382 RepID=UPI002E1060DF|nr:GNAT family N-acetyltransferase [Sinorhizobium meliloti]